MPALLPARSVFSFSSPPLFSLSLSLSSLPGCLWQAADLTIERNPVLKPRPDPSTLVFGKQFSDHMLTVSWSEAGGWEAPQIKPFQNLSLHPASSALHYSIEVRECVSRMAHGIFFSFIQNTIYFISPSLGFFTWILSDALPHQTVKTEIKCLQFFPWYCNGNH